MSPPSGQSLRRVQQKPAGHLRRGLPRYDRTAKYSVTIPTRNRERQLKRLLRSIQRAKNRHEMTPDRVEIVVVDDDGSAHLSETGHILLRNAVQRGASYARNRGIMKAKGRYLLFMDDDIEISEDYFEVLDQVIEEEKPDLLCPRVCPGLPTAPDVFFTLLLSSLRKHGFVSSSNMIIRKEILGGTLERESQGIQGVRGDKTMQLPLRVGFIRSPERRRAIAVQRTRRASQCSQSEARLVHLCRKQRLSL